MDGTPARDCIFGLNGNDRIDGHGGGDLIDGGQGDDVITTGHDDFGNDSILGRRVTTTSSPSMAMTASTAVTATM